MTKIRPFILAAAAATALALAQSGPAQVQEKTLPVAGANTQRYLTAEVHPDRRLTLKIGAPTAEKVELLIGDVSPGEVVYPMTRDKDGVWGATIGPMQPEIYRYSFRMGGAKVNAGFVEVPGTPAPVWQQQHLPHGAVIEHMYPSTAQKRGRILHVYVPPQYHTEPNRRFPVLYLWKPGGWEADWFPGARPRTMFDNLIGLKQAVPMIVVMPDIEVPEGMAQGTPEAREMFDKEMIADILPFVDKTYRTQANRDGRAITGISQSGATAFTVGMRHLDQFGWVGEFGTGFFGGLLNPPGYTSYVAYTPDNIAPNLHRTLKEPARKPRLIYMSVGSDDPRAPFQKKAVDDFQKDGIPVTFRTFAGGHEYTVWRHSIADMAAMLFK